MVEVEPLAEMMWAQVSSRYPGGTPYAEAMRANAAVKTFQDAISKMRQIEKEIGSASNANYKNELEAASGARPEPGDTGGIIGLTEGDKPRSLMEYGERIIARNNNGQRVP